MPPASDPNGADSRVVLDAAPAGQILLPARTRGGAGTCPGLWDKAPLGLGLVPFASDPHLSQAI
jgi:hypothetical protein